MTSRTLWPEGGHKINSIRELSPHVLQELVDYFSVINPITIPIERVSGLGRHQTYGLVVLTSDEPIGNAGSDEEIAWDGELQPTGDPGNMWGAGNPTKLVCQLNGIYVAVGNAAWADNATGRREVKLIKNWVSPTGTEVGRDHRNAVSGGLTACTIAAPFLWRKGDTLSMLVWQNSGAGLNLLGGFSRLGAFRIATG
jgi:hypothetical protein